VLSGEDGKENMRRQAKRRRKQIRKKAAKTKER
jgi:hypothetical protein